MECGGKLFQMSPALFLVLLGRRQETYSDFSDVFQKLCRLKWLTNTADSLLVNDHEYFIYPPVLQDYVLAYLGRTSSLNSLSLKFEPNVIISDNHMIHFAASFSHLTSISFIGAYCQVCILHLRRYGFPHILTSRFYLVCKCFLHFSVPSASILAQWTVGLHLCSPKLRTSYHALHHPDEPHHFAV